MHFKPEYTVAFRNWLDTPYGQRFIAAESYKINYVIPTAIGHSAVILGEPQFADCLQQSSIKQKIIVNPYPVNSAIPTIRARQDKLPIISDAADLVYLAHCLEFTNNPHEVLREGYRILRPDGNIIITMFNPLSVWGVWRHCVKWRNKGPWKANFMTLVKLKDWLALLGFDIMQINHFGYYLPFNKSPFTSNLALGEKYGQKLEFPCGAAYVIEASKRIIPLTPVKPVWSTEVVVDANNLAEPTV